jgi:hypothetical protein
MFKFRNNIIKKEGLRGESSAQTAHTQEVEGDFDSLTPTAVIGNWTGMKGENFAQMITLDKSKHGRYGNEDSVKTLMKNVIKGENGKAYLEARLKPDNLYSDYAYRDLTANEMKKIAADPRVIDGMKIKSEKAGVKVLRNLRAQGIFTDGERDR